jgi:ferredoxin
VAARAEVQVDRDICVGSGICRLTAPTVFVATSDDQSTVDRSAAQPPLELILQAAADCPVQAISVTDAVSGEPLF